MQDAPLSFVILDVLQRTPRWVWAVLLAITLLGLLQWRDHRMTRGRLLAAPVGLGVYSLWSAIGVFGAAAAPAWLAGTALAFAANRSLRWPRTVTLTADRQFALRGSPWPLLMMWGIFVLRYAVAVTLVFHPAMGRQTLAGVALPLAYGLLSGLFAARAWRVLQSAPAGVSAQAA